MFFVLAVIVVIVVLVAISFPKCDVCRCWSGLLFQDSNGVKRCQRCDTAMHEEREEMIAEQNAAIRESWANVKD